VRVLAYPQVSSSIYNFDDSGERLLESLMFPTLVCPCGEQIPLPYRSLRGTASVQPYWPTDSETIVLVCSDCAQSSVHRLSDIRWVDAERLSPTLPPTVFWIVELICDHPHCELPIVAHIRISEDLSPGEVGTKVANATPKPVCAGGYGAKLHEGPNLREVVWIGSDGYLT
jgi:hypothetical protein